MDRYMKANKNSTRQKREEVRTLKERRAQLKSRLNQFSRYAGGSGAKTGTVATSANNSDNNFMSLPDVLQLTMDFANASQLNAAVGGGMASSNPAHLKDVSMNSPASTSSATAADGSAVSSAVHGGGQAPGSAVSHQPMVVDSSPCHSPKVTPVASLANVTSGNDPASAIHATGVDTDVAMDDVEMSEEPPAAKAAAEAVVAALPGNS